jgi:hypothetical protein
LVMVSGSRPLLPTRTVPKSSAAGERVSKDGVAAPMRLMKSSEEDESEKISSAPIRVPEEGEVGRGVVRQSEAGSGGVGETSEIGGGAWADAAVAGGGWEDGVAEYGGKGGGGGVEEGEIEGLGGEEAGAGGGDDGAGEGRLSGGVGG